MSINVWRMLEMKDGITKWFKIYFLILIMSGVMISQAEASSDPRFFGTYCGNHEKHYTVRVWCCFGGHWFVVREERRTLRYSVTAHVDYKETQRGTAW